MQRAESQHITQQTLQNSEHYHVNIVLEYKALQRTQALHCRELCKHVKGFFPLNWNFSHEQKRKKYPKPTCHAQTTSQTHLLCVQTQRRHNCV